MAHPGGRPTLYNLELANKICEAIATNVLPLKKLELKYDFFPTQTTLWEWRDRYPKFSLMYAEAKRKQADLMADEILTIADDGINDKYIDDNGNEKTDTDVVNRSRLRIDTRKWLAAKFAKKVYGESQNIESECVNLPELEECKTYEDKINCILKAVANAKLTVNQGNALANIVEKMCRTFETSEAKPLIEELKKKKNAKKK